MLQINSSTYEQLSELLIESIGSQRFYSDDILFEDEMADYRFTATLMVYFSTTHLPEGYESDISDLVPIWWEFHSTTTEGERLNDFDFKLLKQKVCN